jgi:hypothetical protein
MAGRSSRILGKRRTNPPSKIKWVPRLAPSGRAIEHVQPTAVRLRHAPVLRTRAAEKYGARTLQLMSILGYSDGEIKDMLDAHVIGEKWCDPYLPE